MSYGYYAKADELHHIKDAVEKVVVAILHGRLKSNYLQGLLFIKNHCGTDHR